MKVTKLLESAILIGFLSLNECKKEEALTASEDVLKIERQKIIDTYRSWSMKLMAQDFSGALLYCVPSSNGEGRTRVHKETWDINGQSYDDITHVESWLNNEDLPRNYGEAVGNTTYYQYIPNVGEVEYKLGFYSSTRKIDGLWKIDGFNDDLEPNWWRK